MIVKPIMIRLFNTNDILDINAIYNLHNWTRYLEDDKAFEAMFTHSLATYVYEENNTIKALVRVIGDNTHILYIQDLLVHPTFLRQGIGTQLMSMLLKTYAHVRQKVLITDKTDTRSRAFYESVGFKHVDKVNLTCYVHFSSSL
ncbi:MAG: GNAT family N-acetyltransferase [Bacillota bacterium]